MSNLSLWRNIGISAHIDSGKTTLSERILFYGKKIHKIEEVKGGGDGATMDFMDLEREKGITITSAATQVYWNKNVINLIDTPGHVDFTVEVERSLRVLDGAVLVLCSVGGVQSQSITVDRQMRRYRVPRLAFINKCDRTGANPENVIRQLKEKLNHTPIPMQITIGLENDLRGIIDLVLMKAFYFDGDNGEKIRSEEIPADFMEKAKAARQFMLESLSLYNDEMTELLLDEKEIPLEMIMTTARIACRSNQATLVYMGSAFKNKGVQLLLDAVCQFLPSPIECQKPRAINLDTNEPVELDCDPAKPLAMMAFKLTEEQFGQLTYVRLYQGTLKKGMQVINTRTGKRVRIGRLVRMHANERNDLEGTHAGDICAIVGVDCATGDTFCEEDKTQYACESLFVAEPVIELAIKAKRQEDYIKLSKALNRFMKEDPTFRVYTDPETSETRIKGMGELHLEIYCERIAREYGCEVVVGAPQVSYREALGQASHFDYKHKKQTGGSGQYAHVLGELYPIEDETKESEFINMIKGGAIPNEFIPAVEKSYHECLDKGPLAGFPVLRVGMKLTDGSYHDVDSSEMAFKIATRYAFKEAFVQGEGYLLEPIMKVEVETPVEFQGPITGDLSSRRGMLTGTDMSNDYVVIHADVPLSAMFGYSTDLRSRTQGKATFTMEFARYSRLPSNLEKQAIADAERREAEKRKGN